MENRPDAGKGQETQAVAAPATQPAQVGTVVVLETFKLLNTILGNSLDRRVLITLILTAFAAYCFWIWFLPPDQVAAHGPDQIISAIATLVQNDFFAFGGWIVAGGTALTSWVVVRAVLAQNRSQGDRLRPARQDLDPQRRSSRNPAVAAAVDQMIAESPLRSGDGKQLDLDYSRPGSGPKKKAEEKSS